MSKLKWLIIGGFALICAIYSFFNINKATPIVSLDIKMSRQEALNKAQQLSEKFHLGTKTGKKIVAFQNNNDFQNYVELEAGGKNAFDSIISTNQYSPYTWVVRHFKEKEINEAYFFFTPQGESYGFEEKISEQQIGARLNPDAALSLAQHIAQKDWNINFSEYKLIEKSKEIKKNGRIDYLFTYKKLNTNIGKAEIRMELKLTGGKLTKLKHLAKIPEDFTRKYSQMRSYNDSIFFANLMFFILTFGLFGFIFGLYYQMKNNLIIWKKPLVLAVIISLIANLFVPINFFAFNWFRYETSTTIADFLSAEILQIVLNFILFTMIFFISFITAEGFARRSMLKHIQIWRISNPNVAGSIDVFRLVIIGFCIASILITYDIIFFSVIYKQLGWWSPANSLIDPNILSTPFPWLQSIGISLKAGVWEEFLFRALPIAGVALLVKNKKNKLFWIGFVIVIQAIVFGAAHTNYPQQPAYARLVELFIPFLFFGILYYNLGLIPLIVAHYAIDVVWISLPIFASDGMLDSKIIIIILFLLPIWIVLIYKAFNKGWQRIKPEFYNDSWNENIEYDENRAIQNVDVSQTKLKPYVMKSIILIGSISLIFGGLYSDNRNNYKPLEINRDQAIDISKQHLKSYKLDASWSILSEVSHEISSADKFIFQKEGGDKFLKMQVDYLSNPTFVVRFVKFTNDVTKNTEEFSLKFNQKGNVIEQNHIIPENRHGKSLSEEDAKKIAVSNIKKIYNIDESKLKLISSSPLRFEKRTDWVFVFSESSTYNLKQAETRLSVTISGDELSNNYRYVYVPKEWQRKENALNKEKKLISLIQFFLMLVFVIYGIVLCIYRWSKQNFDKKAALLVFILMFGFSCINSLNSIENIFSNFISSEPFFNQCLKYFGSLTLSVFLNSAIIGLFFGYIAKNIVNTRYLSSKNILSIGIFLSFILLLPIFLVNKDYPQSNLFYQNINSYFPILAIAVEQLLVVISKSVYLMLLIVIVNNISGYFTKRKILSLLVIVLFIFAKNKIGNDSIDVYLLNSFIYALIGIFLYIFVLKSYIYIVPIIWGALVTLDLVHNTLSNPIQTTILGACFGIMFIWSIIFLFINKIYIFDTNK